jgi:hypothetical protein
MRRALPALVAIALAASVASGCGSKDHATGKAGASDSAGAPASGRIGLTDVTSIDQLRDAFNAQSDRPRLILLAAPT